MFIKTVTQKPKHIVQCCLLNYIFIQDMQINSFTGTLQSLISLYTPLAHGSCAAYPAPVILRGYF